MIAQEILNELEYAEDPENAPARLVVAVSNIPTYDHYKMFYPGFRR